MLQKNMFNCHIITELEQINICQFVVCSHLNKVKIKKVEKPETSYIFMYYLLLVLKQLGRKLCNIIPLQLGSLKRMGQPNWGFCKKLQLKRKLTETRTRTVQINLAVKPTAPTCRLLNYDIK